MNNESFYSIRKEVPKRIDETEADYKRRTMLHEDNFSSMSRIDLVCRRILFGTGINISDFNYREKVSLTNYYLSKSRESHEAVINFSKKFGHDGLKVFLSCEYGLELGDKIIDLSEKIDKKLAQELFFAYTNLATKSQNYSYLFDQFIATKNLPTELIQKLPNEISEGIMRRAKDLLFVILKSENIKNLTSGVEKIVSSFKALSLLGDILPKLEEEKQTNYSIKPNLEQTGSDNNYFFDIKDEKEQVSYKLKIFVRPQEDDEGQARINFELIFDTDQPDLELQEQFKQEIIYWPDDKKRRKIKRSSLLRVGLDLETRGLKPGVSLDLGRAKRESQDLIRTGDILGNLLAQYEDEGGHHNTVSFSEELAKPETFADLSIQFRDYLSSLYPQARKVPRAKAA